MHKDKELTDLSCFGCDGVRKGSWLPSQQQYLNFELIFRARLQVSNQVIAQCQSVFRTPDIRNWYRVKRGSSTIKIINTVKQISNKPVPGSRILGKVDREDLC